MRLVVRFQPEETSDLHGPGVHDPGRDEVDGVGVDVLQDGEAVADQLRLSLRRVHRVGGLEDPLGLLLRSEKESKELRNMFINLKE